jgi:hypothetical protein
MRSVGRWLAGHAQRGDIVITGIPNLEQYYGDFTYFFLDDDDPRYEAYVCQNGSTERWTDHAVLYGEQALKSILTPGGRVFASVYPDTEQRLLAAGQSQGWSVTRVWSATDGQADVVLIAATQGSRLQ